MAAIPLHSKVKSPSQDSDSVNPLPQLLQTPSGLALLELQGTINLPSQDDIDSADTTEILDGVNSQHTPIGRLVFPLYDAQQKDGGAGWMKRVYLYVGKHQRLTGEVKKLPKAIAVIRKRDTKRDTSTQEAGAADTGMDGQEERKEELEIVEIVKYKILFSSRPEPVGTADAV